MPTSQKPILHGRDHCPGGADPIPCFPAAPLSGDFADAILTTTDLIGYWRLGDGAAPYDDISGAAPAAPMIDVGTGTAIVNIEDGALATAFDDGAVQFDSATGASHYLQAQNTWGTGSSNRFESAHGDTNVLGFTALGWIKPKASSSTFTGSVLGYRAESVSYSAGWVLAVEWPLRKLFYYRGAGPSYTGTRLDGVVLPADEWTFVAVTSLPGGNDVIYVNGAVAATAAHVACSTSFNISPLIGYAMLVHNGDGGIAYGAVDEAAIFKRALSATEIANLWRSGQPIDPGGAVIISDGTGGWTTGQVGTAAIADDAVTTTKIADDSITAAKIAAGAVGASELASTSVGAGSYGDATHVGQFTVDADGRLTAAANVAISGGGGGGASPADTAGWMPLTTVLAGVPDLVWDAGDSLIPTYTPF